jgi:HD-like signal output (HDOD) protein
MSDVAQELIVMLSRNIIDVKPLTDLLERDPSLSAQMIRYANSPLYAYRGEANTVREAVYHVLGTEKALRIAVGIALGHSFSGPVQGPVGLNQLWQDALYCAYFCQAVAQKQQLVQIDEGTAYLAGLLRNIGFFAMACMQPASYKLFNQIAADNERPLYELQQQIFGIEHTLVGEALFASWKLPATLVAATAQHHRKHPAKEVTPYVRLIQLAELSLADVLVHDAEHHFKLTDLIDEFGLTEEEVKTIRATILGYGDQVVEAARMLAA